MATEPTSRTSLLAELRALVPERPLRFSDAKRVAELQADRFRQLMQITSPELPPEVIPGLPRVQVVEVEDLPTSGSSHWSNGRWIIVINGLEPWQRQRFSLGHELWHVINYKTVNNLLPAERFRAVNAERLADYFSGCLHLPAERLRAAVAAGNDVDDLANLFGVSTAAVAVRLRQQQLTPRDGDVAPPERLHAA